MSTGFSKGPAGVNSMYAQLNVSERTKKEYTTIFDYFYGRFVRDMKKRGNKGFSVNINKQISVIDNIFASMPYEYSNAIKLKIKYKDFIRASKVSSIDKKKLVGYYDTAVKHMYYPKNIELAVPGYYPKPRTEEDEENFHKLIESDFGNNKRIITALHKSNIYYREQLMQHLSLSWFYLWTIPGCGEGSRQGILMAIDKWEGRGNI